MQWPWPRWVLAMVSRSSRFLHTPTPRPPRRRTGGRNPGSRPPQTPCARVLRTRGSPASFGRRSAVPRGSELSAPPCRSCAPPRRLVRCDPWTGSWAGAAVQTEPGARRQDRGHVQAPRPVAAQPDGGPLARLEGELTLAVDGDDARPRIEPVNGSGA